MPYTFDDAFAVVKSLAKDFAANQGHFLSPGYQESEVRKDFIDKFLTALGWDVNHDWQKNPFEQEVKVERGVNMSGSQRRADYGFFIAPNFRDVRWFLEAKKPFGDIATAQNYFQTIRYGWNAQTPVAVLTDFEQFQILDCRYKPDIDTAPAHCLRKFHYSEYADQDNFAFIYYLFSRDAVAGGSLEKYADTLPKKRGKTAQRGLFKDRCQSIDDAFLEELDEYRDTLARSFKKHNPQLDGDTLTEITQRTIDRLVFIRFLEDKLIYPENLISEFGKKTTPWQDFVSASRHLDGIYNGIVFKRHEILDAASFKIDDDAFAGICEKLSHVNSPYDFNSIPIHILGSIYERFLGKVIVTTDKRARVEEKPEVRHAGGVYYTPEPIVRYIVENTVGRVIEGKTPKQIAEMSFADIACGSGSFLLGVYDLLLRHHLQWFNAKPPAAKKAGCVLREDGAWHLSLKQRREILLNNIYGVDIDSQAVEVAQLSLYLKLLQEETTASARGYQLEFHETLLPSLNKNVTCGNSLVGTDMETGELFAADEERKLNPMDYEQRFPGVMKRGGFEAIVGNPPYIAMLQLVKSQTTDTKDYWKKKYNTACGAYDIYILFVEQAVSMLKTKGLLGYIIPNKFLAAEYALEFRKWVLETCEFESLLDLSRAKVWSAGVYPVVAILAKGEPPGEGPTQILSAARSDLSDLVKIGSVPASQLRKIPDNLWSFITQAGAEVLLKIMGAATPLEDIADICGASTVAEGSDYPKLLVESGGQKPSMDLSRFIVSGSVVRYATIWESEPVLFTHKSYLKPLIALKSPMPERRIKQARSPKIIICKVGLEPRAYPDLAGEFVGAYTTYILNPKFQLEFLSGLINSKLMRFVYRRLYDALAMSGGYLRFQPPQIRRLPICNPDLGKAADKARHDKIVSLVQQMLAVQKQRILAQSDKDKDFYANKCESLDRQIDELVYELYGLTENEIRIVEGTAK